MALINLNKSELASFRLYYFTQKSGFRFIKYYLFNLLYFLLLGNLIIQKNIASIIVSSNPFAFRFIHFIYLLFRLRLSSFLFLFIHLKHFLLIVFLLNVFLLILFHFHIVIFNVFLLILFHFHIVIFLLIIIIRLIFCTYF